MPNPFGASGLDFTNHRLNGAATYFDQPDPALLPYGHFEAMSSGGDSGQTVYRFVPNENSGITEQGYVRGPNGENLAQLQDPTGGGLVIDPNQVTQNQQFGTLTNVNNLRSTWDWGDTWMPILVGAGLLGPAAAHAGLFGAGAANSGGLLGGESGAFDMYGSTGLGDVFGGAGGGGGLLGGESGAFDMGGSSGQFGDVFSGAGAGSGVLPPVVDRSVQAGLMDSLRAGPLGGLLSGAGGLSGLLRVAGLGTSLTGLLNGGGGGGGGGGDGNNGGGGGGGGGGLNLTREPFVPNPFTANQIQNFRYTQPRAQGGY